MERKKFKGFSLIELLTALVVMSILGTVGVYAYTSFRDKVSFKADIVVLSLMQLEGRRLVQDGIFLVDIETNLPVLGNYAYVPAASVPAARQISVKRVTDTVMLYAVSGADGCAVLVDRLVGQSSWFMDAGNASICSAEFAAGVALALPPSGSGTNFTQVTFNG